MLYPCILCVALLMNRFVLCVACLTVFVNCLVIQFAIYLDMVVILLLNVKEYVCCACDPSVHIGVPSIGCVCVCR